MYAIKLAACLPVVQCKSFIASYRIATIIQYSIGTF